MQMIKAKNVDEYIVVFPIKVQRLLKQMRKKIKAAEPEVEKTSS